MSLRLSYARPRLRATGCAIRTPCNGREGDWWPARRVVRTSADELCRARGRRTGRIGVSSSRDPQIVRAVIAARPVRVLNNWQGAYMNLRNCCDDFYNSRIVNEMGLCEGKVPTSVGNALIVNWRLRIRRKDALRRGREFASCLG